MKKISKKLMSLLLLLPMATSCSMYHSDPSDISDMVGTYRLKTITKKHNKHEDEYDYKAEIQAEAYFTLDAEGHVFYAYKDKDTPWRVTQAAAIFYHDFDEPTKYDSIKITDGISNVTISESEVGCMGEPEMGFTNKSKSGIFGTNKEIVQAFSYTIPYNDTFRVQQYQYVYYEKISKDGSLGSLNSILGTDYHFDRPIELMNMHGYYAYSAQEYIKRNADSLFIKDLFVASIEKDIGEGHHILAMLSTSKFDKLLSEITMSLYDLFEKGTSSVEEIINIIINGYNIVVDQINLVDETLNVSKMDDESELADYISSMKNQIFHANSCLEDGSIDTVDHIKTAISLILDYKKQNIAFGYAITEDAQIGTYENEEIEYAIIDMESYANGKANLYYSEKADPGMKTATVDIKFVENPNYLRTIVLTMFGKEYYCFNTTSFGYALTDNVPYNEGDKYTSQSFWQILEPGHTLEEVMAVIGVRK